MGIGQLSIFFFLTLESNSEQNQIQQNIIQNVLINIQMTDRTS